MAALGQSVIGRDAELREIQEFFHSRSLEAALLSLEGEAGIGKTTVLRSGIEAAVSAGYTVIECRPVEAEADLSFAGLGDLLLGIDSAVIDALPAPQRRALRVALLIDDPGIASPDPRALGTAVAGVLAGLQQRSPMLVAIDDVQWLDRPSAEALGFAARRAGPLQILVAKRTGGHTPRTDPLASFLPPDRIRTVRLGGLSLGALHHVISRQLGEAPSRPVLARVAHASGGNPFFAVELARAYRETSSTATEPLPVPESLRALVIRRINALSADARELALFASATAAPTRELLGRALGTSAADAFEEAESAGVLEERKGRVRLCHPLLSSTIYALPTAEKRRQLHRRLAALVDGTEERARHLALAAEGPEEDVAGALERASRQALNRGAPTAAAELMELCCELTPPTSPQRDRRTLDLAELQQTCGNAAVAQELVEKLVKTIASGPLRARARSFLAELLYVTGGAPAAVELCEQALREVGDETELRARIHTTLAAVSYDDYSRSLEHARTACALFDTLEGTDPALHAQALLTLAGAQHSFDGTVDMDVVERALALERVARSPRIADRVAAHVGVWLKLAGDFDGARRWLGQTYREAVDEADDASLPYAVSHLPTLELWAGNWGRAAEAAAEHLQLAEQTGQVGQRAQALYNVALVAAHRGEIESARRAIVEVLAFGEEHDDAYSTSLGLSVLGFLELSLGDAEAAVGALERDWELLEEMKVTEPRRSTVDYITSLVETQRLARACEVLDELEARSQAFGRVPMLAQAAHARAVVAVACDDLESAVAAAQEALAHHEAVTVPFDLARTQLVLGRLRRRRREKRLAREALEHALRAFAELGAPLWSERAAEEMARIGLRRVDGDELTPTERRIAELAAGGLTNREIAHAAFVSPKTVEANLARVYRKLGIRSRAELGARMASTAQT